MALAPGSLHLPVFTRFLYVNSENGADNRILNKQRHCQENPRRVFQPVKQEATQNHLYLKFTTLKQFFVANSRKRLRWEHFEKQLFILKTNTQLQQKQTHNIDVLLNYKNSPSNYRLQQFGNKI